MARTDMAQLSRILHRALANMSQSMADRYIQKNAEFRHEAGLSPMIIRTSSGHCCQWCNEVAGKYKYPDVHKDVYRRHDNCDCTVEYVVGKKRQNVWNKQWKSENNSDIIIKRIQEQLKLKDIQVFKSIGAKGKNYFVMDLITGEEYQVVPGTRIRNISVFAGKGVKTKYRDAYKFSERYGGNEEDWQHVKGIALLRTSDGDYLAEIHWSRHEEFGDQEMFVKEWLE